MARRNPFIRPMWATFIAAAIVSNTVDDSLHTLWGMAAWAPFLLAIGLVIGWARNY